jgi:uncharacterized Zn-finger protein
MTFKGSFTFQPLKKGDHSKEEGRMETTKKFLCHHCGELLSTQQSLERHIASIHLKQKPFLCEHCGKRCSQKNNLKSHIESVHEKKRPFACKLCDTGFYLKTDLKRHMESVHSEKEKYLFKTCNHCGDREEKKNLVSRWIQSCEFCNDNYIVCPLCKTSISI